MYRPFQENPLLTLQVKWGEKGATDMGEKLEKAKVLLITRR